MRLEDADLLDRKDVVHAVLDSGMSTTAASIVGEPFDRIAVFTPAALSRASVTGTSGKVSSERKRSINFSRSGRLTIPSVSSA